MLVFPEKYIHYLLCRKTIQCHTIPYFTEEFFLIKKSMAGVDSTLFSASSRCPSGIFFSSAEIHILLTKDVSLQPRRGNSLPFKRELVHRVDEGSAQICFPLLSTFHRPGEHLHNISLAGVGLWWSRRSRSVKNTASEVWNKAADGTLFSWFSSRDCNRYHRDPNWVNISAWIRLSETIHHTRFNRASLRWRECRQECVVTRGGWEQTTTGEIKLKEVITFSLCGVFVMEVINQFAHFG